MKNLDFALGYADKGLQVIPIKGKYGTDAADSKRPLISKWEQVKATQTLIKQWYKEWPLANVGLRTGQDSGTLVLDIDGLKGKESMQNKDLPPTWVAHTRRGHHYYFKWLDTLDKVPTTKVGILPGVDTRGNGGYVVAPPSLYYDGAKYKWEKGGEVFNSPLATPPAWLVDILLTSKAQRTTSGISMVEDPWLMELWKGISSGGRHKALVRYISYFIGKRLPADFTYEILKEWNLKNDPPIDEAKFDSDFQDILQRFKDGRYKSLAPKVTEQTIEDTATQYLNFIEERGKKPKIELTYGLQKLDELSGGLDRGNLEVVGALTKGGKTMFLLNILHHNLMNGKKVVYFPTEMSNNEILTRYFAIAEGIPHDQLRTGQLTPDNKVALNSAIQKYKTSGFHIIRNYQPSLEDIKDAIEKFSPDIVAIDYLQHCHIDTTGTKSASMEEFVKALGQLASERHVALISTAQPSKAKRDYQDGFKVVPMTMHDFADSSIIEKEASKITLIHPGESTKFDRVRPIKIEVVNRHGDSGEINIAFDKDRFKFYD